ncbi:hypothetical protein JAAARDRAFT_209302 [Jaapia argillacea MUCL 33604]|uniref:Histone chaperone RTT106/FACT complex subunit SPT16-like middle domain-containing protein n=1 Tax=Jaapia argillacea MUCL 33604 TaxID=933084 RepID=A0A067PI57_9AGAM|nr:hypothetical protein JAAARDRAFT_209302 [Jaapia argillacea MUCL 33604]
MTTQPLPYLTTLLASLPPTLSDSFETLTQSSQSKQLIDTILRFTLGAECPLNVDDSVRGEWEARQADVLRTFDLLRRGSTVGGTTSNGKRKREDAELPDSDPDTKKQRKSDAEADTEKNNPPLFTLHSISTTSPLRKKVNITIHSSSIQLTTASPSPSSTLEHPPIPLDSIKRAFLLPTRGKPRPHWTVVLLGADVPDPPTKGKDKATGSGNNGNVQIIFGIETSPTTAFVSTTHPSPPNTQPKGTPILPLLEKFLSFLDPTCLPYFTHPPSPTQTTTSVPTSLQTAAGGVAAVEAYKGAKPGSLWFFPQGILWGESKPCEFWAVSDLMGGSGGKGEEGLRVVSATGRTCSVVLTRKIGGDDGEGEDGEEEAEEEGEETQFGMIDGKERDGILEWVRKYRRGFGKAGASAGSSARGAPDAPVERRPGGQGSESPDKGKGKEVAPNGGGEDDSDEEDDDFVDEDDSDGGSATSSDSDSDSILDRDVEVSGSESGDEGSGADEEDVVRRGGSEDDDGEGESEQGDEELDPARHPLMREGAMPKMSRAVIEAVVGMVEEDFVGALGGGGGGARARDVSEEDLDEEDELDE